MSIKIASLTFPINKNSNKKIAYSKRLKQEQSAGFILHINKDTAVINVATYIIVLVIFSITLSFHNKETTFGSLFIVFSYIVYNHCTCTMY